MKTRKTIPYYPIDLDHGLRIDYRQDDGKILGYIRFEDSDTQKYLGSIDYNDKKNLLRLKKVIDFLLNDYNRNKK